MAAKECGKSIDSKTSHLMRTGACGVRRVAGWGLQAGGTGLRAGCTGLRARRVCGGGAHEDEVGLGPVRQRGHGAWLHAHGLHVGGGAPARVEGAQGVGTHLEREDASRRQPRCKLEREEACARAGREGRAWSAAEFAALLASPHVFVTGDARGFALGRVIADEAELLTLATDPGHRRQGRAHACLAAFAEEAQARGAATAFLEVAEDNAAALALYAQAGFGETARRAGYYPGGRAAVVMQRPL